METQTFTHRFVPATNPEEKRTLLLLHGTGGNEDDLVPLGTTLLRGAAWRIASRTFRRSLRLLWGCR